MAYKRDPEAAEAANKLRAAYLKTYYLLPEAPEGRFIGPWGGGGRMLYNLARESLSFNPSVDPAMEMATTALAPATVGMSRAGKPILKKGMEHLKKFVRMSETPIHTARPRTAHAQAKNAVRSMRESPRRMRGDHNVQNEGARWYPGQGGVFTKYDPKPEWIDPFYTMSPADAHRVAAEMPAWKALSQKLPKGSVIVPQTAKLPNAHMASMVEEFLQRYGGTTADEGVRRLYVNDIMTDLERSANGNTIGELTDRLRKYFNVDANTTGEAKERFNTAIKQMIARSEIDAIEMADGNFWVVNTEAVYNPRGTRLAAKAEESPIELIKTYESRTLNPRAPWTEITHDGDIAVGHPFQYGRNNAQIDPASVPNRISDDEILDYIGENDIIFDRDTNTYIDRYGVEMTWEDLREGLTETAATTRPQNPPSLVAERRRNLYNLPRETEYNLVDRSTGKSVGVGTAQHRGFNDKGGKMQFDVSAPGGKKWQGSAREMQTVVGTDYPPGAYRTLRSNRVSGIVMANSLRTHKGKEWYKAFKAQKPADMDFNEYVTRAYGDPYRYGLDDNDIATMRGLISRASFGREVGIRPGGSASRRPFKQQNERLRELGILSPLVK